MTDCLFCKIIEGEIGSTTIYSDDDVVAIEDINPQAPVHLLILPRKHIATTMDIEDDDLELMGRCLVAAKLLAKEKGIDQTGFRIVLNAGPDAGQSVYHLHYHVLGGRPMKWPPG
ncbi:MAG: histidine triad nucleotide-binding protein [Nitrospinae bacterium]|nr:histidine triad nucleotide-binding protein [Nitrospinota bacterium]